MTQFTKESAAVADSLLASETTVEDMIIHASSMSASIIQARRALGLPFGDAQMALTDSAQALTHAIESRRFIARTHAHLRKSADAAGIDWAASMYGDVFDTPPNGPAPSGSIAQPDIVEAS